MMSKSNIKSDNEVFYALADRMFKSSIFKDEKLGRWFIEKLMQDYKSGFLIKDYVKENVELPISNKNDKEKRIDILLYVNNKYLINIEANSNGKRETNIKNFTYLANIYSQLVKRGKEYVNKYHLVSIDITSGLDSDDDVEISYYHIQNEKGKKYIQNFVKVVYNLDKIMESWYTRDEEGIKKYFYIMMLQMEDSELEELEKYVSKEDRDYLEIFRERMAFINMNIKFYAPWTEEEEREIDMNLAKAAGLEEGSETAKIETAKNMAKDNVPAELISKYVGLPLKRVQKILASIVL